MSAVEFTEADLDARAVRWRTPRRARAVAFAVVADRVAHRHGLTAPVMLGPSRTQHVAAARADLYQELRDMGWSYPAIGAACGGRDHTTVMYALRERPRPPRSS